MLPELSESLEIHFHLPHQSFINDNILHLVVNHSLCIASHNPEDVSELKATFLNPMQCAVFLVLVSTFLIMILVNRYRRLYWNYLWNHPAHVSLPSRAIEEALDALMWFYVSRFLISQTSTVLTSIQTDNLISGTKSVVPFSKSECNELSSILRDLSGQPLPNLCYVTQLSSSFRLWQVCG